MNVTRARVDIAAEGIDDVAWSQVVDLERAAGQRLFGYAVHMGVDGARAADLVQDALMRLWRELRKGSVIEFPEGWAFRTLSRLIADEFRLHRRIERLVVRLAVRTPFVEEIDLTEHADVWAQVDRLPRRQRQAVYLRYRADLAYEEVALVMGITPAAARSHASHAIATLRATLAEGDIR